MFSMLPPRILSAAILSLAVLAGCGQHDRDNRTGTSGTAPKSPGASALAATFVKDASCRECHARQFGQWRGSDHERAMDHATPQSVLGDFDNATFTSFDEHWRFFREGDDYKIGYRKGDGEEKIYPVAYTFGWKPLQQYLVPFPGGRYQTVPVSWDVEKEQWYHLYPEEPIPEGDPLHWTGRLQTWNYMCAECHSTNVQTGFDNATDTFNTTFSDINVGCQSCHGPGSTHLEWARQPKGTRQNTDRGLAVNFKWNDAQYQAAQCARCHSRRSPARAEDEPTRPFLDNFRLSTLDENLYFPDGQIHDEVYVYGSFIQSAMYHAGVRCSDCHDPHTTELVAPDNNLCVRCHQNVPLAPFPTLEPGIFDDPSHHFHESGTPGAQCVNCHMPERTYMGIDERRDHSFRVPRPDLSVTLGTPNACTQCHADRDAQWAADTVKEWYGDAGRSGEAHFATAIAAGRAGEPAAEAALAELAQNDETPAIVRATALELLTDYGGRAATDALLAGLKDPSPLVRAQAAGGMDRLPPAARGEVLGPLLIDPMASVRMEAVRLLAGLSEMDGKTDAALDEAIAEYTALQRALGDQPEAHLNMGLLHASLGDVVAAETAYKTAIEREPAFIPARVNLANLYNSQGRNSDAEHLLTEALALAPNEGELQYSMGLLLAEMARMDEALVYMKRATELLPERSRVFYNYGLLLQHLGQRAAAESALKRAHSLAEADASVLQALVILYSQEERWEEAKPYARKLLALDPQNPDLQHWVGDILSR